jgi:hypothetical protein
LPHKKRVGLFGRNVAGNPGNHLAVQGCDYASRRKVTALQQVQIMGVQIEWLASIHKVEYGSAIFEHGMSQNDIMFGHLDEMALLLAGPFVINK